MGQLYCKNKQTDRKKRSGLWLQEVGQGKPELDKGSQKPQTSNYKLLGM